MGRSQSVYRSSRLVGFLLLTVGIVYIVMRIYASFEEGFQTLDASTCRVTTDVQGMRVWLCGTKGDAVQLNLNECTVPSECGADTTRLQKVDGLCYRSDPPYTSTFVCYDRPAPTVLDPVFGIKESIALEDDPAPDLHMTTYKTTCRSMPAAIRTLYNSFLSTNVLYKSVREEVTTLSMTAQNLSNLYSDYCSATANSNVQRVCPVVLQTASTLHVYSQDTNLLAALRLVETANNQMSNLLYINVANGISGFSEACIPPIPDVPI